MFIAPMHSYVTSVLVYNLHTTIFSRAYSFITRMLPVCTRMLLVCTRMLLVCSRVYSYVTRMYSYVTRMLLVCSFSHDQSFSGKSLKLEFATTLNHQFYFRLGIKSSQVTYGRSHMQTRFK